MARLGRSGEEAFQSWERVGCHTLQYGIDLTEYYMHGICINNTFQIVADYM